MFSTSVSYTGITHFKDYLVALSLVPRSKNEWSYTSTPPIRLHGVVLRWNTGTTLALPILNELIVTCLFYVIWDSDRTRFSLCQWWSASSLPRATFSRRKICATEWNVFI